ncbi:aminotransferase class I/II-fold pyridoxal phosphate-dependent enzyme [Clostridium aestuarii]|uniref:Aminotransferase class I/II-fold pyridoxal phosphate-dependent enzyme n=1 Tax=Clostridium aestuarii TaxID=338193 RepID=A0ABT4CY72_9CLOT|nr:aminotransferase class I/II-fold pyridoxal phosphate-dependent enzyme [Clostridium aestuarii]MCY6482753.1 aminotransferase class I/II-fold pyridoxal phosphate-dependent enzyme [Clostridium aestuarii]
MIKLPLATTTWDNEEYKAIKRVINSNRFSMGKEVKEFEEEFANYFGTKYAVMVNSGSSANLLAVAALLFSSKYNLKKGDEVIVPAVSWATTFFPLQQYGLKIRFVDIDLDTLNIDLDKVEKAVTKNTKAIFAVNLLGNSIEYDRLEEIVNKYNLILIEDNCESMGAKFKGKFTGTFGIMGTFSTFFSHHISTMEGGMIVTDDKELRDILVCLRAHGWTRQLSKTSEIYSKKDEEFYEAFNFILPGYNVRPLEFEGAVGKEQLKKINIIIKKRRENGKVFEKLFSKIDYIRIQKSIGESSYFGFAIIIKDNALFSRGDLINLFNRNGIECRPIVAGNFTKNKVIEYFDYSVYNSLDNSDYIHERGLFIGNHHYNIIDKLQRICGLIQDLQNNGL